MKTPCLKCGLIHDEPTAICDGYAGIDPDETAGDTRKKAAERIRAVLAAVPIESRRAGRARAAAAGVGASASESTAAMRAAGAGSLSSDPAETPPAEVPEWRREVTERLETYRNRRARQSREGGNQSVLAFRVHSRTDMADPAEESRRMAAAPAEMEAPVDGRGPAEAAAPTPAPMAAASVPATEPAAATRAMTRSERVYAADETDLTESLSEHAFAAATEASESDTEASKNMGIVEEPIAEEKAPASLPMATEPAVVLADPSILEVHADPAELPLAMEDDEETARLSPAASAQIAAFAAEAPARAAAAAAASAPAPATAPATLPAPVPAASIQNAEAAAAAVILAIDKDYWRAAPDAGPETGGHKETISSEASAEAEELECGSLTSGFDSPAGGIEESMDEESAPAEEAESGGLHSEPSEAAAPGERSELPSEEAPSSAADDEEPATEALAAAENTSELLPPGALDIPEIEDMESRRAALRTAARRQPGAVPERIEISVPQPVFDFTAANPQNEQPQDNALPVADLRERRRAAFIDATVLAFAIGGFFFAFHLAGGDFSYTRVGAAVAVAAAFLIYAQYILLFTLVGGATPGMALRGLRVVCFDGRAPESVELGWRSFGYLLSAAAGMLGFVWSAWDEHGLSWHDRISQTYITYAEPEGEPVVATVQ